MRRSLPHPDPTPPATTRKLLLTIRVRPDIVAAYRATGPGWQTRMHRALERGAARLRAAA